MNKEMKRIVAFVALLVLAGCYAGPGTSSRGDAVLAVSTPSSVDTGLPVGVVTPKPVIGFYEGIYRPQGTEPCCWLSSRAAFQVRLPAHAKSVDITVFLPDLAVYHDRPEALTVSSNHYGASTFSGLTPGEHLLQYKVSPWRGNFVTLNLKPAYAFVPAKQHINGDTRLLSMYLRSVVAR